MLFVKNGVYTSDDDLYFDNYMQRCEKDDLFVFYGDEEKTFEIENGERKCDDAEEDGQVFQPHGTSRVRDASGLCDDHARGCALR